MPTRSEQRATIIAGRIEVCTIPESTVGRKKGERLSGVFGIKAFYGPFGDFSDPAACEAQFRNAFLMGCAGAWTLHPSQVAIAKRVFSPDVAEVKFALKILAAMPDGSGAVMIDGKMQDDATWKQAKVVVDLARIVAGKDQEMGERYGV
jgi:malyl-CoA/(S)-citramalyl-CoA lyase